MDFELIIKIAPLMLEAAWVTVKLAFWSFWLGVLVASILVTLRLSGIKLLAWASLAYVSFIRGTPFFVQLLIFYYGTPYFIGISFAPYTAGVLAIGLNVGAYMSEAIRGSIAAVDKGQNEASRSIGFSRINTMFYIILPQAAGLMIRSIGVLTVILTKSSSLVSAISVVELTYSAQRLISSTYKPIEVFGLAAVFYLIIIYGITFIVNWSYRRYTRYLN